jgi:predicted nucleotidyltransferase component of viral defense system
MIEISMDERVLKPAQKRKVIHEYGEPFEAEVRAYALEEIIAEKLRAILQHAEKIEERGWSRSRARDYYDLWRMLGAYKDQMDLSDFNAFFQEKCAVRQVAFTGPDDFFETAMLNYVEKTWEQWLGPLISKLPSFETVISGLRPQIMALFSTPR